MRVELTIDRLVKDGLIPLTEEELDVLDRNIVERYGEKKANQLLEGFYRYNKTIKVAEVRTTIVLEIDEKEKAA